MKKIYILLSIFFISCLHIAAQDSIYIYKNNQVISKYATSEIDSITFQRAVVQPRPILFSFSFGTQANSFLYQQLDASIDGNLITATVPLIDRYLTPTFTTDAGNKVVANGVEQVSGVTRLNFTNPVTYKVTTPDNQTAQYTVRVNWETGLPEITINTLNEEPIVSKDIYVRAYIQIDGKGFYPNFADSTGIRGRGNSTWGMPKKPYRLKLDNDGTPFGLAEEKDWVLLANYLDPTHLMNPVAFKVGQMLGLPFTNHAVPVSVTLNGKYVGVYTFTEQVERSKSRVNIDKNAGALLELDSYFDEPFKFRSFVYTLPVMVKEPDLEEMPSQQQYDIFNLIQNDFADLEFAMDDPNFPANNYKDYIDIESLVKYLLVYDITSNLEINHPKSTYMHKDVGKKYFMGPIWDFDWAYGFEGTNKHFSTYSQNVLTKFSSKATGYDFFKRFLDDPEVKALYKSTWNEFKSKNLDKLVEYIGLNGINITQDQLLDRAVWGNGTSDYSRKIKEFQTWMYNRAGHIDGVLSTW